MYRHILHILLPVMLMAFPSALKAQIIAVNSDVLSDACLAPNLGVELGMSSRSTLSLNAIYGRNILASNIKMTAVQPEWRFYFSGRPMYHHFVGIGLIGASYEATVDSRVYNGDGVGAGVTFGYVLPLNSHWNIDFHAGCGAFYYRQKEHYVDEDYTKYMEDGREVANSRGTSIVPTRIGVSISYIIK